MIMQPQPETWTCTLEDRMYVVRDAKGAKVCRSDVQRHAVMAAIYAAKLVQRSVRIVDGGKAGGK